MDKLHAYVRRRDNKRVEFYSELRNGKLVYIIREVEGASQDSVTPDKSAMEAFRDGLLHEGYMEMPF